MVLMMGKCRGIIIFLVALCLFGASCTKATGDRYIVELYSYTADADTSFVLENERLLFEMDPATTYFTVTDKLNGTVWHSNPPNASDDTRAVGMFKQQLLSTLIVEYSTPNGLKILHNNYEYSISRELFDIVRHEDEIEVKYSIGNIVKQFIIPYAIPESRYLELMDRMDTSTQKRVREYFKKYDISNLNDADREYLEANFPGVLEETEELVYILRDIFNKKDQEKGSYETMFKTIDYTQEEYEEDLARYNIEFSNDKLIYNISICYRIEGNELVVSLPIDKMDWEPDNPLTRLSVLPNFGAGEVEDDGFILVPEGGGAIIGFNNGKTQQTNYYTDIYGWDYGLKRDILISENRSNFPVFGISRNGSSMLCILEDYASVASIEADISGKNTSYNTANASYKIIHGDAAAMSSRSDEAVMLYEKNTLSGEIRQRYAFLGTDSYADMARAYRDYLLDKYEGMAKKDEASVPVNINMVGAIDKKGQKLGLIMSIDVPLTTYKAAAEILKDLEARGFGNMNVVYTGWMNGGLTHKALTSIRTIPALGSKKDLKAFISYADSKDIPVYLEGNVMFAPDYGILDRYFINSNTAKYTTREVIKLHEYSAVAFVSYTYGDSYYFVKPQVMGKYTDNLLEAARKHNASGIALRDVGYKLGADYNPKNHIIREDVIKGQQEILKDIINAGDGVVTYGGNEYIVAYSDYVLNMDFYGNPYMIIDYNVPFYQMAIHGLVDYFGTPVNLARDYTDMLLKNVEYGAGLSFTFMMDAATTLQESYYYTDLYGAHYELWKELATQIYTRYDSELSHLFGQYMTGHKRLAEGVYETTYEDGTKVYVNYNNKDFNYEGVVIPSRDYVVERGNR